MRLHHEIRVDFERMDILDRRSVLFGRPFSRSMGASCFRLFLGAARFVFFAKVPTVFAAWQAFRRGAFELAARDLRSARWFCLPLFKRGMRLLEDGGPNVFVHISTAISGAT